MMYATVTMADAHGHFWMALAVSVYKILRTVLSHAISIPVLETLAIGSVMITVLATAALVSSVSRRKKVEDTLREGEDKFRQMADNIQEIFWMVDATSKELLYVNPAFEQVTGRTAADLLVAPLSYREMIDPHDRERVLRSLDEAERTGRFEETFRIARPDGSVRWVWTRGSSVRDAQGTIYRLVGVAQDVTEQKRTEEWMRKIAAIVEFSDDAIISKDLNGVITSWNAGAERMFGYSQAEAVGQSITMLIPPEARAEEAEILRRLASGEHAQHYETVRVSKTGKRVDVSLTISPMKDAEGRVVGVAKIARDISERGRAQAALRKSEANAKSRAEELQVILDAVPGMALIAGDPACRRMTGSRTTYEILRAPYGANLSKSAPDNERPRHFHALENGRELSADQLPVQRAARTAREVRDSEITIAFEDGAKRDFVGNAAPLLDRNGQVRGAVGIFIDITERNRTEQALRESQAQLARVTRSVAMGELTTTIAHEVNQPLTAVVTDIGASLRWLAQDPPNLEEARAALAVAVSEANRASGVIDRIRGLLRNTRPMKERLELRELIAETLAMARNELREHGVTAGTDLAASPRSVQGDRILLQQLLLNLILNGIDAMRTISDRARELLIKSALHRDGILLQVMDTGTGLDPAQSRRIFQPFFTTKPQGIGMGLSISRSIVETHGGRLWATANTPHGAIFQFTLPRVPDEYE